MKKFLIWLLILVLIGLALFILFPILVLLFIVWQDFTRPSTILNPIEPNLDFVDSKLEYLYYVNDKHSDGRSLYIGSIDGKSNNLIANNADIVYYYNSKRDKIAFLTDKKDKKKSFIKVYNLKSKNMEDSFEIDRQKYNSNLGAPQFSPDNTRLLYTIDDRDNYKDYVFIINLINKSNELAFNTDNEMYGNARWDINNNDIWMYRYSRKNNAEHYFKINPQKSTTQTVLYTNFDEVTMAKIFGLNIEWWKISTPFENRNDREFVLKENDRILIKYDPGIGIESTFNINDFDYTKDMKYLLFTINGKIYICDIKTGKIGYLTEGTHPRLIGENSSINRPIKSFYDVN